MRITARVALPGDREGIWGLYEQAMRGYIEAVWGWDQTWQDDNFDNAFRDSLTYVVENDCEQLGYFQIDPDESHDHLRILILKPAARSAGIGAQILARVLKIAHGNGKGLLLRVLKLNVGARRFYEREGWRVLAKEDALFLMGHPCNPAGQQPDASAPQTARSYAFVIR